jgi:hypothetical protein
MSLCIFKRVVAHITAVNDTKEGVQFLESDVFEWTFALCIEIHFQAVYERSFRRMDDASFFFAE